MSAIKESTVSMLAQEIRRRYVPVLPLKAEKLEGFKETFDASDAELIAALSLLTKDYWPTDAKGKEIPRQPVDEGLGSVSLEALFEVGTKAPSFCPEQREIFEGFKALMSDSKKRAIFGVSSKFSYAPALAEALTAVAAGKIGGDLKKYIGQLDHTASKSQPPYQNVLHSILSITTLGTAGPLGLSMLFSGMPKGPIPSQEAAAIARNMHEAAKTLR